MNNEKNWMLSLMFFIKDLFDQLKFNINNVFSPFLYDEDEEIYDEDEEIYDEDEEIYDEDEEIYDEDEEIYDEDEKSNNKNIN